MKFNKLKIEDNLVYDVKEVANILNLHPRTVKKLIEGQEIIGAKVGREHRIIGENIKVFLSAASVSVPRKLLTEKIKE